MDSACETQSHLVRRACAARLGRISRESFGPAVVLGAAHGARPQAEALIEQVYLRTFASNITAHFPHMIATLTPDGRIAGAVGFRWAMEEPLFLEHYLDGPIEDALAQVRQEDVTRAQIVEIGNLAANDGAASVHLFAALADHVREAGAKYACVTATRALRRTFRMFGFETMQLATAAPARIPGGGKAWGRYYDHDPIVLAGSVPACRAALSQRLATENAQ